MPVETETVETAQAIRVEVIACQSAEVQRDVARNWYTRCKRSCDFVLALVMLVPAAPVIAICVFLVRLTSRGPGLYSQARVGLNGRVYQIFKIRTMYHNCEGLSGPQWSQKGDSRVTGLGRFLRRTHLDELPQLWNVLKGEMSLVGPRPERPEFIPTLAQAIPHYRQRLEVRPGVTGLAQVQLPADTDLRSVRRKLAYDLHYAEHISLWLDMRLLVATAGKVLGVPFRLTRMVLRLPCASAVETIRVRFESIKAEKNRDGALLRNVKRTPTLQDA
jgi:lipopolysaccharide/colanic/teichoic acid biosynthesis glycosyltransferase